MAPASQAGMINASEELKNLVHDEFAILNVLQAAIDASPAIPERNKVLAQNFLAESMNTLWDQVEDILTMDIEDVPVGVIEHWNTIREMARALFT